MDIIITSIHNTAMFLIATLPLAVLVGWAALNVASGNRSE